MKKLSVLDGFAVGAEYLFDRMSAAADGCGGISATVCDQAGMGNGITNRAFGNADYRVFLSGETHAKQKGYEAKKTADSVFSREAEGGLSDFEIGMGHGFRWMIIFELGMRKTCDFSWELKGTMAYSQEEYEFWQWLYEYNQQQPQKRKLHVLGLDIEFQANSSARGLSLLLDESVTPAQEIRPLIEKLKASDGEALGKLPKAMEQYPQEMQEAFGENFAGTAVCQEYNGDGYILSGAQGNRR